MARTDARPAADRALTELEACVVGVVLDQAPCTAYAVRAVFAASPTKRWSGSAGAIYPLVERLAEAGLLDGLQQPRGTRTKTLYRVTDTGREALTRWLALPIEDEAVAIPVDPVRTRLYCLSVLAPAQQLRWAAAIENGLRTQRTSLREAWDRDAFTSDLDRLAHRGLLDLAEARLTWFASVRAFLIARAANADEPPSTTPTHEAQGKDAGR